MSVLDKAKLTKMNLMNLCAEVALAQEESIQLWCMSPSFFEMAFVEFAVHHTFPSIHFLSVIQFSVCVCVLGGVGVGGSVAGHDTFHLSYCLNCNFIGLV